MAIKSTGKTKPTGVTIALPKLAAGAKSRQRPKDQTESGSTLQQRLAYSLMNRSTADYRNIANQPAQITALMRELCRIEGPISTAVHNLVQVANSGFKIWVTDVESERFSYDGWLMARKIMSLFNTVYDYTEGFSERASMQTTVEVLLREAVITGGNALEMVLNKARLPDSLVPIGVETLEWISDGKGGKYPGQRIAGSGQDITPLDIATFYVSFSQPDPGMVQARSMMESAMKLLVYFEELLQDIRRVIRRNGHTRTKVALNTEKLIAAAPKDVKNDAKKLLAWMERARADVETVIAGLDPEDVLITFDTADVQNLQSGMGSRTDYTPFLATISGLYSSAMKTPPSALGLRMEGGQSMANVESLIFLKSARSIQTPVADVLSRALTLACRLYGFNVSCNFMFNPIDLRPENELSAFRTMEQDRILRRLSLGLISDEEAAWHLDVVLPEGYVNLAGTRFMDNASPDPGAEAAPGDSGMGKTLQPGSDLPRKGGGKSQ